MRAFWLLTLANCAVIPAALRPAPDARARPEWVDVHERAFYERDGAVILVYGVGSLRRDSELCRPELARTVLEGRALPPMQQFLGEGETEVIDHTEAIVENGREWNKQSTARVRRAGGALHMVTTRGAWYDHDDEKLYILRRAIAPAKGLDLLPPEEIDTSSTQSFDYAMRAYLAACAPPTPEADETLASEELHPSLEPSPCSGHCRHRTAIVTCAERCRTDGPSRLCSCRAVPPPRTGPPRPALVTDL